MEKYDKLREQNEASNLAKIFNGVVVETQTELIPELKRNRKKWYEMSKKKSGKQVNWSTKRWINGRTKRTNATKGK